MRVHLKSASNTKEFAALLLTIGNGTLPSTDGTTVQIPKALGLNLPSPEDLLNHVYPDIHLHAHNIEWLIERAILAPHNDTVREINWQLLQKYPGQETVFTSIDTVPQDDQAVQYPSEFLNSLHPSGMPPHLLTVKVGIPIICLRNLTPTMANGTRMIVTNITPNCLQVTIATGPNILHSTHPFDSQRLRLAILLQKSPIPCTTLLCHDHQQSPRPNT
ncbi:uncharacterized protein LOC119725411 [Patiria miniata]|uniref:DNA helicase Pif1-like 2B domain-containing protein n=1 Tax=Patiria miniata TaxID=46514 RepID=A0A913ZLR6_PATMI|nr:uncharacterized protein LOC119725411 [Patiria miniata]